MRLAEINPFIRYASELKFHGHSDFVGVRDCRILYIAEGTGIFETKENSYNLEPGHLLYCPAGSVYQLKTKTALVLFILNFDLTQQACKIKFSLQPIPAEAFRQDKILIQDRLEDVLLLNEVFLFKNGACYFPVIQKIIDEFARHKIYYRERTSAQLKELLILLCREKENGPENSLNKVIEYIRNHYSQEISNRQLAELAGYHEYYLNRCFVKHTGLSLHKYLVKLRLREAQRLLLNTELPIVEIAEQTGFRNTTYFSDCFAREYNMPPSKYRKTFRNKV